MHEAAYAGHDTIVKLLVAAGGNNLACNSVSYACRLLFGLQFVRNPIVRLRRSQSETVCQNRLTPCHKDCFA
jgi:hypothetical protein